MKMNMQERYILGIDQGGTKTAAAVMRGDGFIVGQAVTRGAYFPNEGLESAASAMREAAESALKSAGVGCKDIELAVAGVGGVDWPGDEELVTDALRAKLPLGEIFVCNDAVIAFYSGTLRSHGAVICAGTGMNGALIDREGRRFVYGDYMEEKAQGGSALARRAARKVFDAQLGLCPPTKLTGLFLEQAAVPDVDILLRRYMTEDDFRKELRFLVPQILMIAGQGDAVTCGLVSEFAEEITAYVAAGFRKMKMRPEEEEVVLAGSVFKGTENPLTKQVVKRIEERFAGTKVVRAHYEPVVGACIMGLARMHRELSELEKGIQESAAVLGLCYG